MLPDKDRMCHRTGFTLSCRELVVSDKCKRWKQTPLENRLTKAQLDMWGCIDDMKADLLMFLGLQVEGLRGAMDKVHTGLTEAHVAKLNATLDLVGAIEGREQRRELPASQPKMIEAHQ